VNRCYSSIRPDTYPYRCPWGGIERIQQLRGKSHYNPARLLFLALDRNDLDRRVVEALPWLTFRYSDLDWERLLRNAKLNDRQNRLGFIVDLAEELADKTGHATRRKSLSENKAITDRSRLAREDTLSNAKGSGAWRTAIPEIWRLFGSRHRCAAILRIRESSPGEVCHRSSGNVVF
jgi:hypothetical protein